MSNITIGRYDGLVPAGVDETSPWSGWVEGEDASGKSWIIYLDGASRPALYWPEREESGAVVGEPIKL